MTRGVVNPGICGKVTIIEVVKISNRKVGVKINSDCKMVTKLGKSLAELDQWDALKPQVDSVVYKQASKYCSHASCPIPMAILKAIEVEVGLALPRPVSLYLETVE